MLALSDADQLLEKLSTARLAGDIDAIMPLFHDDAVFRVVGIGPPAKGKDAVRSAILTLIETFEFLEWTKIQSFVNGDEIAARHRLKVRRAPDGDMNETETCEFLSMKDGKCISYTQYADTAMVFAMMRS